MENSNLTMDHQIARVRRPFARTGRGYVTRWVAEASAEDWLTTGCFWPLPHQRRPWSGIGQSWRLPSSDSSDVDPMWIG